LGKRTVKRLFAALVVLGERIYHAPGGRWYSRTKINEAKGERWFCSEEEARAAGWRRAYE
jgi:hypothetical protein